MTLLAVLAGCGPSTSPGDPRGEPVAVTGGEPAEVEDGAPAEGTQATEELFLGLTEWSIETAGRTVLPGTVRVVITNAGATGHDVVIHGQEGSWATPVLGPGERHEMVIETVAGEELELICTVTGHADHGMRTTLSVAGPEGG